MLSRGNSLIEGSVCTNPESYRPIGRAYSLIREKFTVPRKRPRGNGAVHRLDARISSDGQVATLRTRVGTTPTRPRTHARALRVDLSRQALRPILPTDAELGPIDTWFDATVHTFRANIVVKNQPNAACVFVLTTMLPSPAAFSEFLPNYRSAPDSSKWKRRCFLASPRPSMMDHAETRRHHLVPRSLGPHRWPVPSESGLPSALPACCVGVMIAAPTVVLVPRGVSLLSRHVFPLTREYFRVAGYFASTAAEEAIWDWRLSSQRLAVDFCDWRLRRNAWPCVGRRRGKVANREGE